jgi:hypothetical protein
MLEKGLRIRRSRSECPHCQSENGLEQTVCGYELWKNAMETRVKDLGQELVIDVQKCNGSPVGNFLGTMAA